MATDTLSLFGEEDSPSAAFSVFFALMPENPDSDKLALVSERLRRQFGITGNPIRPEMMHISLHHLGDFPQSGYPPDLLKRVKQVGDSLATPAFDITLDHVARYGKDNRAFVLAGAGAGVEKAISFHRALAIALAKVGMRGTKFTPHMTLAYTPASAPQLQAVEPVTWTARQLVLVVSFLKRTHYEYLARWPLH